MNEIEKMYENAGIKPIKQGYCDWDSLCPYEDLICVTDCPYWKYEGEAKYPPFTAEKQIELIKWLSKLAGKLEISSNYNDTQYLLYFYLNRKTRDEILPNISTGRNENFEESLAGLINNLWQDLTEEERKQIKEILK